MATAIPPIYVEFRGNANDLLAEIRKVTRALPEVEKQAQKASKSFGLLKGAVAAVSFAVVARGMKTMITGASDLAESVSKVNVVFGANAAEVQKWAKSTANSMGISRQAALEAAGTYGNLFKAFGIGDKDAQTMSTSLVKLAGDLASFNNTSVDDAILALRSGLSGETEPLKRFGIAINENRLKLEAQRLEIYNGVGVMSQAAKTQAAYSLIMKDSTLAQGDYARTAGGFANQMKTLQANIKDTGDSLGAIFLPYLTDLATKINSDVMPNIQAFVNGLTGDTSVLASLDESGQAAYIWGARVVGIFNTIMEFKPLLIGLGAVMVAVWAINAVAAGVSATVSAIRVVMGAYKLLKAQAIVTGTAVAFALGPLAGGIGVVAMVAALAAAEALASKFGNTALPEMPKAFTGAPDGVKQKLAGADGSIDLGVDPAGTGGGKSKKSKLAAAAKAAAQAAKDAAEQAARDAKEYADRTAQVAKDIANTILSNTRSYWATIVSAAEEARNIAKEQYDKTLGLLQSSVSGLGSSLNITEKGSTGAGMVGYFKRQLTKIKEFVSDVTKLQGMGLHPMFISQLIAAGPESGSRAARALVNNSGSIAELNAMQTEFLGIAQGASGLYKESTTLSDMAMRSGAGIGYTTAESAYQNSLSNQAASVGAAERAAAQYDQTNNMTFNIDGSTYEDPARLAQAIADAVASGVKAVPMPAAATPAPTPAAKPASKPVIKKAPTYTPKAVFKPMIKGR